MIGSTEIIGKVRERFDEIFRLDRRWDEWRSFYNGWVEGRTDLLLTTIREGKIAYEFHNLKTGHCYVDYSAQQGMDEADGWTKTPLYKIET